MNGLVNTQIVKIITKQILDNDRVNLTGNIHIIISSLDDETNTVTTVDAIVDTDIVPEFDAYTDPAKEVKISIQ